MFIIPFKLADIALLDKLQIGLLLRSNFVLRYVFKEFDDTLATCYFEGRQIEGATMV